MSKTISLKKKKLKLKTINDFKKLTRDINGLADIYKETVEKATSNAQTNSDAMNENINDIAEQMNEVITNMNIDIDINPVVF